MRTYLNECFIYDQRTATQLLIMIRSCVHHNIIFRCAQHTRCIGTSMFRMDGRISMYKKEDVVHRRKIAFHLRRSHSIRTGDSISQIKWTCTKQGLRDEKEEEGVKSNMLPACLYTIPNQPGSPASRARQFVASMLFV